MSVSDGGSVNFRFNKGQQINISKFNGASKEDLIKKAGGIDTAQGKLIETIFQKYDNGDGFLTATEYNIMQTDMRGIAGDDNLGGRELKRLNKDKLGADTNAFAMEDWAGVIGMMNDDTDSITNIQEADNGDISVTYKPDDGGAVTTKTFEPNKEEPSKPTLKQQVVVNGKVTTTTTYGADGKPTQEVTVDSEKGETTTVTYQDGKPASKTVKKGTVTTEFKYDDVGNEVKTKETNDKGSGIVETSEYTYDEQGNATVITYNNSDGINKPTSRKTIDANTKEERTDYFGKGDASYPQRTVVKNDDKVETLVYKYNDDGNQSGYDTYDGDVELEAGQDGKLTVKGKVKPASTTKTNGKDYGPATFGNSGETTKVSTKGANWYQIVEREYPAAKGNHKVIMAIVHAMKDQNIEGNYKTNAMPATINIPTSVTVNGKVYTVNATEATDVGGLPANSPKPEENPDEMPATVEPKGVR